MRPRLVLALVLAAACTRQAPPVERPHEELVDASPPVADAGEPREPLAGFPENDALREGSELVAVVSVPLGAREPRPILIALHGGSDRPERACPAWRIASDAYPFVVCPRGWGGDEARLAWSSVGDTEARIARAIAATKKRYGTWVKDTDTLVLAGFSMGAAEVARVAESRPPVYRRIVIGDAAHDPGPALRFSRAWAAGGGERAMFMCTTSGCEPSMRASAKAVAAQRGPASRLVVAPTQVHALSSRAASSLRRDWPWLVDGAEGWEHYVAPSDATPDGRTETF